MAFTDENELIKKSITHVVTEATNPLTKLPPAIAAMNIPIGFTSIIKTAVARHTEHVRQTSQNPLEYYQEMKDYIDRIIQSLADTIPTSQKEASFVCAAYLPTFRRTFNDIVEHTLQDISWYTPEQSETPHATLPAHNKERRTISLPWHDHTLSPLGRSTSVRVNPFDPSVPLFFLPNTGFSFPTPPQFTHTSAPQADGMSHHADFGHTPLMTFSDENNSIKDAIEEVFRQTTKNHLQHAAVSLY